MLKLYFSPSSSSLATHIALIECGADFELAPRLISKQETRTPDYLAINPDGKVPALVTESGQVLTEVAATLYDIARKHPGSRPLARRRSGRRGTGDLMDVVRGVLTACFARQRAGARGPCPCRCEPQARRSAMGDRALLHRRHSSVPGLLAVSARCQRGARHLSSARGASRPHAFPAGCAEGSRGRKCLCIGGSRRSVGSTGVTPYPPGLAGVRS